MIVAPARAHNNFTILRLALAWAVFMGHYKLLQGVWYPPFPFVYADFSVDCFFVVSGYLIAMSWDADGDLRRFYIRRFFRLYPLYLTVVLVQAAGMAALVAARGDPNVVSQTLRYVAVNAVFMNFLQYDIGHIVASLPNPGINPSLWTLKVEVGFYLFLPLIWTAVKRWGWPVIAAIFVASAAWSITFHAIGDRTLAQQLPGQLQFFVLGVALYRWRAKLPAHGWAWIAALPVLLVYATLAMRSPILYPLVIAAIVCIIALRTRALELKLDISYGVYLVHGPVIQFSMLLGLFHDSVPGFLLLGACVISLALLAERMVERPFIAVGKRLSRGVKRQPVLSPANG